MKDGTVKNGYADGYGGNIQVAADGLFKMSGGVVSGGKAVKGSGNIGVIGNAEITGGKIINGTATGAEAQGGNIRNFGTLTIKNAKITGGNAPVGGGVYYGKNGDNGFTVSATATVKDNTNGNIYFASGAAAINFTDVDENSEFNISTSKPCEFASFEGEDIGALYNQKEIFVSDDSEKTITCRLDTKNKKAYYRVTGADEHIHCTCMGSVKSGEKLPDGTLHYCSDVVWEKATEDKIKTSGFYYLDSDLKLSTQASYSSAVDSNVCLNGHTIESANTKRVFMLNNSDTKLSIYDHKGNSGELKKDGDSTAEGGVVHIEKGTFNMYGGKINANGYSVTSASAVYGGTVRVASGGTFNMFDGVITGGKAPRGGNIGIKGTVNMYGGMVQYGTATNGNGGNIAVDKVTNATFNMFGGTVLGGTGNSGANIWLNPATYFNMTGGEIKDGITLGTSNDDKRSLNIFANAAIMKISGGNIAGYVDLYGATEIHISGNTVIDKGTTNLYLSSAAKLTLGEFKEGAKVSISMAGQDNNVAVCSTFPKNALDFIKPDNTAFTFAVFGGNIVFKTK